MIIGQVVDHFIATQKNPAFEGQKLLLIQPLSLGGEERGEPVLAIDGVDAGIGDRVLLVQDGWAAMKVLGKFFTPVDAAVIGVIDHVDLYEGASGLRKE
ncbi:MAG: EutN/CcmL family microcompartment protein [Acidobacteriota bacterium]